MIWKMNFQKTLSFIASLAMVLQPALSYADRDDHHDRRDPRDHYYRYHDHPRFGLRVNFISNDYVPVVAGRTRYYYYDGLYYVPAGNDYVMVSPPMGAIVPVLPPEYRPVLINGVRYYTDAGIFYVFTGRGYQVVPAPVVQPVPQRVMVQPVPQPQNQTKVAEGAGLGGILGALIGGIVGHQQKGHHELGGALIGGVAGAATGGILGAQVPNQDATPRPGSVIRSMPVPPSPAPVTVSPATVTGESFTVTISNGQGGYSPVIIRRSGSGFVGPQGEYYPEFPKVSQLQAMYSTRHSQ